MEKKFFEGELYRKGEFKGLIPKYYPAKYKQYIQEEIALLKLNIKGSNRILEAGVGIGRLIPILAPIVKEFIGIDNSKFMLEGSKKVAKNFPNVKIIEGNIEELRNQFPKNYFDYSLCVWNTLGNVEDPVKSLKELSEVTSKSIFITTFYKGTIKDRLEFYKSVEVEVVKIDKEKELFYLNGYTSKTFNAKDIQELAKKTGLVVKGTKLLGGVIIWAELSKPN